MGVVRLLGRFHVRIYRLTGGRFVGRVGKAPILLLTTIGRRSGEPRTAPLLYLRDGERLAIVASFGGHPKHPVWYLNLAANPEVKVQVGRETFGAIASTAGAEDRERLWPQFVEMYPGYAGYKKKTSREIPIVLLTRVQRLDAD
ncbi:MAG: nitroreductase family deazaflavin-dependent oxidoreductase [Gaiellaceae bacterium]